MLIVKRIPQVDPMDAPFAAVGAESGVVIRTFERRISALEFVEFMNKSEVKS